MAGERKIMLFSAISGIAQAKERRFFFETRRLSKLLQLTSFLEPIFLN